MGLLGPSSKDLKAKSDWTKAGKYAAKAKEMKAKGKDEQSIHASNKSEFYARRARGLGW